MTAGAMRGALLVVAVALGAVVIANAFPGGAAVPVTHPSSSPSGTRPSPHPSKSKHPLSCPSAQGVRIAVENAANHTGLAAATATKLKAAGYVINASTDISDATSIQPTTTVFYRHPADKKLAMCMKKKYFPAAVVNPMSAGGTSARPAFSQSVQVAVFLGQDYAASHPIH